MFFLSDKPLPSIPEDMELKEEQPGTVEAASTAQKDAISPRISMNVAINSLQRRVDVESGSFLALIILLLLIGGSYIHLLQSKLAQTGAPQPIKEPLAFHIVGENEMTTTAITYRLLADGKFRIIFKLRSQEVKLGDGGKFFVNYAVTRLPDGYTREGRTKEIVHYNNTIQNGTSFSFPTIYEVEVNLYSEEIPRKIEVEYEVHLGETVKGPWHTAKFNKTFHLKTKDGFWMDLFKEQGIEKKNGQGKKNWW